VSLGKRIRLNRIFGHPSGRLCSVAVDHLMNYGNDWGSAPPAGLLHIGPTIDAIMAAQPDAMTMHKGIATSLWTPYAGKAPLILQCSLIRTDDSIFEHVVGVEEAVRLGADAIAVAAFVRGNSEAKHMRAVAEYVREAARFELPVICHIYPRVFEGGVRISFAPDDIAWAVRCAVEMGVDVVKSPYCGEPAAYRQIANDCPVPLVAAGGPQTRSLEEALGMMLAVVENGGMGATIGRNIWGITQITEAVHAFKAVIHDKMAPADAIRAAGL
jgi:class I fructose-bisphosphate aldolase